MKISDKTFDVHPVGAIDTKAGLAFTLKDLAKVIRFYRPYCLPREKRVISPDIH